MRQESTKKEVKDWLRGNNYAWYKIKKDKVFPITIKKIEGITPEDLLKKSGYKLLSNGSYRKPLDFEHIYHAFIIDESYIELHTDLLKPDKNGITYHVASTYKCKAERRRIKEILPDFNKPKTLKIKRNIYLPREEYLKAMEELEKKRFKG